MNLQQRSDWDYPIQETETIPSSLQLQASKQKIIFELLNRAPEDKLLLLIKIKYWDNPMHLWNSPTERMENLEYDIMRVEHILRAFGGSIKTMKSSDYSVILSCSPECLKYLIRWYFWEIEEIKELPKPIDSLRSFS
mgnify:CR=1 FL=1